MAFTYKNNKEFVQALKSDVALQAAMQNDVADTINNVTIKEVPNTLVYQLVVISLILTILLIIIGLLVMVMNDKTTANQNILTIFTALASTAVGALAGVLMPVEKKEQ